MNTNLLIVEGPDCAGKTTLINELMKKYQNPHMIHHNAYLNDTNATLWYNYLIPMVDAYNHNTIHSDLIFDRSWIAEPIYGQVMRGGQDRIQVYQKRSLERIALSLGAVVVYCLPPVETCVGYFKDRMDIEYLNKIDQLKQVHFNYVNQSEQAQRSGLYGLVYDYTNESVDSLIQRISMLRDMYGENLGPGIGEFAPGGRTTLILSDRSSGTNAVQDGFPFIALDRGGCSAWLNEILEANGISERGLYWVNVNSMDGTEIVNGSFIDRLRPIQIITLGNEALDWFEGYESMFLNKFNHVHLHHPQYHKRFRSRELYQLISILKKKGD